MKCSFFIFITVLLFSCNRNKQAISATTGGEKFSIALQPFFDDTSLINKLKARLESTLNASFKVLPEIELPTSSFYSPRKRYIADNILVFLKDKKNASFKKIIGVTNKDISTSKDGKKNWGIMGLAYCPGEPCIISSFRVLPTIKNKKQLIDRMTVLALHELGHTFSLPHCENDNCIMVDAEGKMKLGYTKTYCSACRIVLEQQGILRLIN